MPQAEDQPLAGGFNSRQETGFRLADGLRPGETILLVPAAAEDPGGGLAAAGASSGTGKTQLAVGFAHAMWSSRAVDLLVWVAAGNRTAIVAGYARAAADLHGQGGIDLGQRLRREFDVNDVSEHLHDMSDCVSHVSSVP